MKTKLYSNKSISQLPVRTRLVSRIYLCPLHLFGQNLVLWPHLVARRAWKCCLLSGSHMPNHKRRAQWTLQATGRDEVKVNMCLVARLSWLPFFVALGPSLVPSSINRDLGLL